jgi:hypothetical protein
MESALYTEDGILTHVKVIGFPGNESMWVRPDANSTENEGTGTLDNDPFCSDLKHGEVIKYGGGTDIMKPRYISVVPKRDVEVFR